MAKEPKSGLKTPLITGLFPGLFISWPQKPPSSLPFIQGLRIGPLTFPTGHPLPQLSAVAPVNPPPGRKSRAETQIRAPEPGILKNKVDISLTVSQGLSIAASTSSMPQPPGPTPGQYCSVPRRYSISRSCQLYPPNTLIPNIHTHLDLPVKIQAIPRSGRDGTR